MKKILALALVLSGSVSAFAASAPTPVLQGQRQYGQAEDWKGPSDPSEVGFGGLFGMGVMDNKIGFAVIGNASKKLADRGLIPDVNESMWLEAEAGPLFLSGGTAFFYSLHARWDFIKDEDWTLYGLGGLAGDIAGKALGDRFELYPRFGMGAFWHIAPAITLRGEISHELIAAGVAFSL